LQRAQRANPAAEESSQKERGHKDQQAPDKAPIERVTGQRIRQGHQRIPLEEEAHRRAQLDFRRAMEEQAHRGEQQQHQKKQQKEDLRNPAPSRQSGSIHESPSR
jgi:hypothetical protein